MDAAEESLTTLEGFFQFSLDALNDIIRLDVAGSYCPQICKEIEGSILALLSTPEYINNSDAKKHLLESIIRRLKRYFPAGSITNEAEFNIRAYYDHPEKYNWKQDVATKGEFINIWKAYLQPYLEQDHVEDVQYFQNEKLRKNFKLPVINYSPQDIFARMKELTHKGYFDSFIRFVQDANWKVIAPRSLQPYITFTVEYERERIKNQALWRIIGFSLKQLAEVESNLITFKSLFHFPSNYINVEQAFRRHGFISSTGEYLGFQQYTISKPKSVAGLIAIVEAFIARKVFRSDIFDPQSRKALTTSNYVKIMADYFGLKCSKAALTKKSKDHELMKREIIQLLDSIRLI